MLPGQAAGLYETQGMNGGLVFPVGAGFEMYMTDTLSSNAHANSVPRSTPFLDDYQPGSMKVFDPISNQYTTQTAPLPTGVTAGNNDEFLTVGLGFTYYVFGNSDLTGWYHECHPKSRSVQMKTIQIRMVTVFLMDIYMGLRNTRSIRTDSKIAPFRKRRIAPIL
ncbi:MAG: hypothetical protein IPH49_02580 [Ignavibacteria bacterium]|nr:hypothetical protein [Ignavibacteria bacterium]